MSGARDYRDIPLADPFAMQKWREEADEFQRKVEAENRRRAAETSETRSSAELRVRVEKLEDDMATMLSALEAVAAALDKCSEKIADKIERDKTELKGLIERRCADLWTHVSRLAASVADSKQATAAKFKFAGEKSDELEALDLPNPISRTVN